MATYQTARTAWKVQADVYSGMDFPAYREIIHETAAIQEFLSETRGEHFIVSAPKGFGKTLLLIAKRKQMEEHGGYHSAASNEENAASTMPGSTSGNEYLDRPGGNLPTMSKSLIDILAIDYYFWRSIWRICIVIATLKLDARFCANTTLIGNLECDKWIKTILLDRETIYSPCTIFTGLVGIDVTMRQRVIRTAGMLDPYFRAVRSPTAFFIDNVDHYFEPLLEDRRAGGGETNRSYHRSKSNDIWAVAQLGLVGAAYAIHMENGHVKAYCTVRREAFDRLHEFAGQEAIQMMGCSVEIEYSRKDLQEIFIKNIQSMLPHRRFGLPDPMQDFFGPTYREIRHRFVDRIETGFDFLLRHTFYRPRDLMILGDRIAKIDVADRNPSSIKLAVDEATDTVVNSLMDDMKPFFFLPDLHLLAPLIDKNILTREDLDEVSEHYKRKFEEDRSRDTADERYARPFLTLYQTGMLGWITVENDKELRCRQKFLKPREIKLQNHAKLPTTVSYYLIHSALDHLILKEAGDDYRRQFHRQNVIGNDAPWIEPATSLFVIKGDMVSFSKVMESEFYSAVSGNMHAWAETACEDLDYFEVSGGDSIVMIDRSADRLMRSVSALLKNSAAYEEFKLTFRFGGSAGPISFKKRIRRINGIAEPHTLPLGLALRTSARVEPHAPHGSLVVDDAFVKISQMKQGNLEFEELGPEEIPRLEFQAGKSTFRIQKNPGDPACETKLYRAHSSL